MSTIRIWRKVVFVTLVIFYFIPEDLLIDSRTVWQTCCLHEKFLGFECPGCGFTRASYYMLHFNFRKGFIYNPTSIFLFPILFFEIIYFDRQFEYLKKNKYFVYQSFVISLLILYLFRAYNHFN